MRKRNCSVLRWFGSCTAPDLQFALHSDLPGLAVGFHQRYLHGIHAAPVTIVFQLGAHVDGRVAAAERGGAGKDAGTAEIVERNVGRIPRGDERHPAIQAARHVEVAAERSDGGQVAVRQGRAIVGLDQQHVLLAAQELARHVEPERGKGALVLPELLAVEPDVGDDAGAVELQPLRRARARTVEFQPVPALATLVVLAGRGRLFGRGGVDRVPGVRQVDRGPG